MNSTLLNRRIFRAQVQNIQHAGVLRQDRQIHGCITWKNKTPFARWENIWQPEGSNVKSVLYFAFATEDCVVKMVKLKNTYIVTYIYMYIHVYTYICIYVNIYRCCFWQKTLGASLAGLFLEFAPKECHKSTQQECGHEISIQSHVKKWVKRTCLTSRSCLYFFGLYRSSLSRPEGTEVDDANRDRNRPQAICTPWLVEQCTEYDEFWHHHHAWRCKWLSIVHLKQCRNYEANAAKAQKGLFQRTSSSKSSNSTI